MDFPKILLAAPTSCHKAYCQQAWCEHILKLDYPCLDILIVDNSDTEENSHVLKELLGDKGKVIYYKPKPNENLREKIKCSMEIIRSEFLSGEYSFMLSLETDIFIYTPYIIEHLVSLSMSYEKPIVGLPYFHYGGSDTSFIHMERDYSHGANIIDHQIVQDLSFHKYLKPDLQLVHQCGMGCLLISRRILQDIEFRWNESEHETGFPDFFFHKDVEALGCTVWLDFRVIADHYNDLDGWNKVLETEKM